MAVRIQIRRDTSANWTSNNPVLYPGEIGVETDTKKFKIGPVPTAPAVATAWNSITAYANVVPSDLSNTLGDYILAADLGVADGPAKLNVDGNLLIPEDSIIFEGATANDFETTLTVADPTEDRTITLPNVTGTVITTGDTGSVTNTMLAGSIANEKLTNSAITINGTSTSLGGTRTLYTDDVTEDGSPTNLWFTDERAQDAVAAALAAGTHTNITVTYTDETNAISLVGATTYSDENAQDAIGNSLGTGLSYNDTTGAISVDTTTIQARVADVSDTEIGYLNGVTSAIQTQIDAKLASATASSTYAPINNPTFTGTVTLPGNPGSANEAATKSYVDNISAGLNFHAAVHAATAADLTATYDNSAKTLSASGAFPQIDSHTINETERILVKSQTNAVQNGIYTLTDDGDPSGTWVLTRASDADNTPGGEVSYGDFTFVQNGTLNGGQGFIMTTTGTITLGTSNIVYTQFNTGQAVIAGNGLSEATPGTLSINTAITADISTAQTFTNKTLTSPTLTFPYIESGINFGISGGGAGTNGQVIQSDGTNSRWASLTTTSSTTAITSNSAVTIDTVALLDFVSIEYQLTIKQGTSIRSSKVLVQTDGTSVDYSEYGIVSTGTAITGVAVAASVSSTNMILQVTISNATTTVARAFVVKNTIIGVAPAAPTIGTATGGAALATVTFTPQDNGGSAITSYTVTSSPGSITASGSSSPIIVTSLTPGTAYTFSVTATNKYGTSAASSATNSVTPTEPPTQAGYTGSGRDGVYIAGLDRMRFDNETSSTVASGLTQTFTQYHGVSNSGVAGYFAYDTSPSVAIDKWLYDGDTRSTLSSGFSRSRSGGTAYSNSGTAGYILGGRTKLPTNIASSSSVSKMTYSNETGSELGNKLTYETGSQQYVAGFSNNAVAGYQLGGRNYNTNTNQNSIQKMTFSNESNSAIAATLSTTTFSNSAFSNSGTAGYINLGPYSSTVDKLQFSNDTKSSLAETFMTSSNTASNAKVGSAGYWTGLYISSNASRHANKINFSNDTISTVNNVLSVARSNLGSYSNSGIL
jgi:hypothetical protein